MKNSEKEKNEKISLVKYKASDLNILFPDNENLTAKEKDVARNAITKAGIVRNDGQTFVNKDEMPKLLNTDKKGANKVYNDFEDDDKFEDGNSKYADTSAILKEVSKRIQDPRPQLEREKLKYNRDCMNAFIDAPKLEKERSIESDRIQKGLPNMTKKKMKAENISCDQLTGEEFDNDAQGHHIERKADKPKEALNLNNIVVTKERNHKEIHDKGAEDRESLKKLANEKSWNTTNI